MYTEEMLSISTGKLTVICKICEFNLLIQNKLIQTDNDLTSAENRGYTFMLVIASSLIRETGCLFKDLFSGIQGVICSSWFPNHYTYQYLSVIMLFNKSLVPQGQEKKKRKSGEKTMSCIPVGYFH